MVQTLHLEAFLLHMVAQVETETLLLPMEDVEQVAEYRGLLYLEVVERRVVMVAHAPAWVEIMDRGVVESAEMAATTQLHQHLEMEVSDLHLCLDQQPIT